MDCVKNINAYKCRKIMKYQVFSLCYMELKHYNRALHIINKNILNGKEVAKLTFLSLVPNLTLKIFHFIS